MFECGGKQDLLIVGKLEYIALDVSEISFDALHFFSFEVFKNPSCDGETDSNSGRYGVELILAMGSEPSYRLPQDQPDNQSISSLLLQTQS